MSAYLRFRPACREAVLQQLCAAICGQSSATGFAPGLEFRIVLLVGRELPMQSLDVIGEEGVS